MYSNKLVCKILAYINNNITNKISIHDLENMFFYNRYYIMKLFKKEIKLSIIEYINYVKIYNCINDLKNKDTSLTNIALKNGFYSLEYFSETFKQITKLNPRKFKDYFNRKKSLSQNEINLINESIVKLYEISNIKTNYSSKQKPEINPVKKLSIFNKKTML